MKIGSNFIVIEDRGYGIEYPMGTFKSKEGAEKEAERLNNIAESANWLPEEEASMYLDGNGKPHFYYVEEQEEQEELPVPTEKREKVKKPTPAKK